MEILWKTSLATREVSVMVLGNQVRGDRAAPLPGNASGIRDPQPRLDQLRCGILPKHNAGGKRKVFEIFEAGPHRIHKISTKPGTLKLHDRIGRETNEMRVESQSRDKNAQPVFHKPDFNRSFPNLNAKQFHLAGPEKETPVCRGCKSASLLAAVSRGENSRARSIERGRWTHPRQFARHSFARRLRQR